jgi:hypothetical protein
VGGGLLMVSAWSVLEFEGELTGLPQRELLDAFLAERCPVVCFEPDLAAAAGLMSYPVEELCFTSSSWGAASLKPSCR